MEPRACGSNTVRSFLGSGVLPSQDRRRVGRGFRRRRRFLVFIGRALEDVVGRGRDLRPQLVTVEHAAGALDGVEQHLAVREVAE
jgi:hypothetical protein